MRLPEALYHICVAAGKSTRQWRYSSRDQGEVHAEEFWGWHLQCRRRYTDCCEEPPLNASDFLIGQLIRGSVPFQDFCTACFALANHVRVHLR